MAPRNPIEPAAKPPPGMAMHPCSACSVRDMSICSVLTSDELAELAAIATTLSVGPHRTIVDEGEPADYLFNVTAGAIKLYKLLPDGRRQITGFLFQGDFLGIALNERYAYSAESVDGAQLCRFPRRKLEGLLDRFPHLEKRLLGVASNELVQAQDQMLLLGRKTAREKLASFLLSLSRRQTARGAPANPVGVPMGRADIADFLGLTTETVSRTFTLLKNDHSIQLLPGGQVALPTPEALEEIAEGA